MGEQKVKSALEFVEEYLKKEAGDYYENNGFEFCFREWIVDDIIYREVRGSSRWWNNLFCVANIGGELIGFGWAETTGDNNIFDVGWVFDKSSMCYVTKKEVTKTIYEPV